MTHEKIAEEEFKKHWKISGYSQGQKDKIKLSIYRVAKACFELGKNYEEPKEKPFIDPKQLSFVQ